MPSGSFPILQPLVKEGGRKRLGGKLPPAEGAQSTPPCPLLRLVWGPPDILDSLTRGPQGSFAQHWHTHNPEFYQYGNAGCKIQQTCCRCRSRTASKECLDEEIAGLVWKARWNTPEKWKTQLGTWREMCQTLVFMFPKNPMNSITLGCSGSFFRAS